MVNKTFSYSNFSALFSNTNFELFIQIYKAKTFTRFEPSIISKYKKT